MLPAWAEHYVGIPYRPLGRDRDGCDCWGLLAMVWREQFGCDLPDYPGERWNEGVSAQKVADGAQTYAAQFAPVQAGQEALGDGILLRNVDRHRHNFKLVHTLTNHQPYLFHWIDIVGSSKITPCI